MGQSNDRITAIYGRIAQFNEISYQTRIERMYSFAYQQDLVNPVVFFDAGYSGLNDDRPAFQSMLELIFNNQISAVYVEDQYRLGRDYWLVEAFLDAAYGMGVAVHSFYDGQIFPHNSFACFRNTFQMRENMRREMGR